MTAWLTYLRGSQLLGRAIDDQLRAEAELSHAEFEILGRLSAAPGHRLRMGELAERLVAPKSRLSYQVDRLVARGLVLRQPHPADRRGLEAVITDVGLDLLAVTAPGHLAAVRANLIDLLSSADLDHLTRIMTIVSGSAEPEHGPR
jgi:DNA-binding MarR family transcriptional regulator